ncbi:MAG: NADH-quinone oxidoreductase subunit M [Candidatus Bathyarchaeota archaeon]|nr:NADH-quinone oxidoreductase subunit M [Candidatus Bathyarchaeota archaeon]
MVMQYSLILALAIPLLAVAVTYFAGKMMGKNVGWLVAASLVVSLALLAGVALGITDGGAYREVYSWAPQVGLGFTLLADGLSIWVLLTINILCLAITVYSMPYMEHRFHEWEHETHETKGPEAFGSYFALYLLYTVGMLGTVMSTNLIQFYVFYELMLIPSWLLINNYGYGDREKIGMIYFMWTTLGAVILLAGILAAYAITGSFEISSLTRLVGVSNAAWIAGAMLFAFFTKMAVFGLHTWLPFAHAEAPTPISALLSPAMIGIGAYAALRLVIIPMTPVFQTFSWVFTLWALVTMIYGGMMALTQDDIKRFLAYSSISQMGYIFLGLASVTPNGEVGAMFHYVSHGFGKAILFLVAGVLISQTGTRSIKKMGGLADKMPWTAVMALIGFLTIGGVPPTMGFMSKFFIFAGVFNNGLATPELVWAGVVGIIMTILTIGYGMWMIRRVFYGPLPEHLKQVKEAPMTMLLPIVVFAVLVIVLGIWPTLITGYLSPFFAAGV